MAASGLSFDNPLFSKFVFYAGVVLLKTVFMSIWTAVYRIRKQVILSILTVVLRFQIYSYDTVFSGLHVCGAKKSLKLAAS